MLILILLYALLGAGVKYIDDAFDEHTFNKNIAYILAPILGGIWAYAMSLDIASATILLAILIGVLLKNKIDNYAFVIGVACVIPLIILLEAEILFVPFLVLTGFAVVDEYGNDLADRNDNLNGWIKRFFKCRCTLELCVIFLALLGVIPPLLVVAVLVFDLAYLSVGHVSKRIKRD